MTLVRASILATTALALGLSAGCAGVDDSQSDDLVGGKHDTSASPFGYLVHGKTLDTVDAKVRCGATLIAPNVVVTAAHCVTAEPDGTWGFGLGDVGSGTLTEVAEVVTHPEFHAKPTGSFDVHYFLRNNDVAYLILDHDVLDVTPAKLADAKPKMGCKYYATGYSGSAHMRTPACLEFNVTLGDDPIFEVHPSGSSSLCQRDGDEGSPLVTYGKTPTLYGFYVGSVTQGLTDCRKGTQFLDGYESAFGFASFFEEGIARGKASAH